MSTGDFDWTNVISTVTTSNDVVYFDYVDTGVRYPTDEELLENMNIKTVEKFLRKKKLDKIYEKKE